MKTKMKLFGSSLELYLPFAALLIGLLMMPKTCAYVWTVLIGYRSMKKHLAGESK